MSLAIPESLAGLVTDLLADPSLATSRPGSSDGGDRGHPVGERHRPAGALVPLTAMDELCLHLDTARYPWTIELELRAPGHLDEERVRAAARGAAARHPLARARLRPYRLTDRRYDWEVADEPEGDATWVVHAPTDERMAVVRGEILSAGIPLDHAPPFRLWLVRRPGGDSLILSTSHVASDGMGALRLLRSIVRAYAGAADPVPPFDLDAGRDLARLAGPSGVVEHLERLIGVGGSLRRAGGRLSRVATEGADDRASGFGVHHVVVPGDQLAGLDPDRHTTATVNDLLLAALHLGIADWNADHCHETDRISVMMPMNLRPRSSWHEGMANLTGVVPVSSSPPDRDDAETLVRAIAAQTARAKRAGTASVLLDVLEQSKLLPSVAKRAIPLLSPLSGDVLIDTAVLSNLGRVDEPFDFGPGPEGGPARELWFSPPVRFPLGVGLGAATHGGDLHLSFRSCRTQFDADAAAAFAGYVCGALDFVG